MFARVLNAFALVRFGQTPTANISGDRADEFLIDTVNRNGSSGRSVESDTLGRFDNDGVRVTEREVKIFALLSGTIADASDFKVFSEARRDADDHIVNQSA